MQRSHTLIFCAFFVVSSSSTALADRKGVDYVPSQNALVFGGSRYWEQTQNLEDLHTLYVEQVGSNQRKVVLHSEGVFSDIQAAPQGDLFGVLERMWEENVTKDRATYIDRRIDETGNLKETYYFESSKLIILGLDGATRGIVDGVRRFSWAPTAHRIAYITGDYSDDGVGFKTTGTWIYDVSAKQSTPIFSGGVDVQWAQWDGNVYIYDSSSKESAKSPVLRFDGVADKLISTSHHGIHFSPDGKYYYSAGNEGADVKVFDTTNDLQVPINLSSPSDPSRIAYSAEGWLSPETLIVPSPLPGDLGDYLYEIGSGRVRHSTGAVVPKEVQNSGVLVIQGGSVVERSLDSFALQ